MSQENQQPTPEQISTRFVVGIDLGTTNVAVSFVDCDGDGTVQQFDIPQLTHPGELGSAALLPSFCYLPGEHELPHGALELPWDSHPDHAVGIFAREQGAAVPGRLVASAKSWLAHAGVDRTRPILPWASDLGDQKVSPVDVSFYYLDHIRQAWDRAFGTLTDRDGTPCVLAEQQVILTVPASFDEAARELTVRAAKRANLQKLTLIEEPLAAFYCWLSQHENSWRDTLAEDEIVLVIDVGGGTTDFSLIHVETGYTLRRTAVGEHLLLGGDNMDMRLAREAETAWKTKLDPREWSLLCQECRKAKERLLGDAPPEACDIVVAGSGSSVIAATRTFTFERSHVTEDLVDGFFPGIPVDAPPPERRRGIRQMGLPYAADPAVTRHLLQFLRLAGQEDGLVRPSRILFNGGAMLPKPIRDRVSEVVGTWCDLDGPLPHLHSQDLNLAVSRGAAYYGLVRQGSGVRVKGGIARAYYLEVGEHDQSALICVMPRDTDEDNVQKLDRPFALRTNEPVAFPLYSSATRLGDELGDVIADREELTPLPPLTTVLRYGKQKARTITVHLATKLNAVGTLDVWLDSRESDHVYPLSFDLRSAQEQSESSDAGITVDEQVADQARRLIAEAFTGTGNLKKLTGRLEETLDMPRSDWGVHLLRRFADDLIRLSAERKRTPEHEARWLNLTGFTMRPGFGCPGDEWRVRELWKAWHAGPLAGRNAQVASEWWVFWRRIAGGLRTGHQQQIGGGLLRELVTDVGKRLDPKKRNPQEAREMWRCLGALERMSPKAKTRILRLLLGGDHSLDSHHYWVLARAGARRLFHGPADAVVPAEKLEPMLPALFEDVQQQKGGRMALLALSNLCRLTAVRGLDVSDNAREKARALLEAANAPEEWIRHTSEVVEDSATFQAEITGDDLPLGLVFEED
jgi:hypothetical protein